MTKLCKFPSELVERFVTGDAHEKEKLRSEIEELLLQTRAVSAPDTFARFDKISELNRKIGIDLGMFLEYFVWDETYFPFKVSNVQLDRKYQECEEEE